VFRKTPRVIALGATVSLLALATATQSSAYDKERYGYAATHMIEHSVIPKSLGPMTDKLNFYVLPGSKSQRIYLCSGIPTSDPDEFKQVAVKAPVSSYNGSYNSDPSLTTNQKNFRYTSLSVTVNEFSTASAASKTFDLIKERAKKCKGTKTTTTPGDGDVPDSSYTNSYRNGQLASVTFNGQPSVYVETDFLNQEPQNDATVGSGTDNLTIYSLVGSVVIQTMYSNSQVTRLSSKKKNGVARVANAAIQAWRG